MFGINTTLGGTFNVVAGSETPTFAISASIDNDVLTYVINPTIITDEYTLTIEYSLNDYDFVGPEGECNPIPSQAVITIISTQETGFDLPDVFCEANFPIDLTLFTENGDTNGDGIVDGTYFDANNLPISDPANYQPNITGNTLLQITYQPVSYTHLRAHETS